MADYFKRKESIPVGISEVFERIRNSTDWDVLFTNQTTEQAEILLLTRMFSGAGVIGLLSHGARKSLVFVKLMKLDSTTTEVTVISGGTEAALGLDFGRHKRNVSKIFDSLKKYTSFRR
jgi:hypothetical protein